MLHMWLPFGVINNNKIFPDTSRFRNYTPTVKGHVLSEGCATNRQHSKSNYSLVRRGQLEDLNVREPLSTGTRLCPRPCCETYGAPPDPLTGGEEACCPLQEGKVKGPYTWYSASSWVITSEALRYGTCSQGISQFYLHTHTFIRNRNEPYLPLPSQL